MSDRALVDHGQDSATLPPPETLEAAEVVLPCDDFDANLDFFRHSLGFKIETLFPADDPSTAILFGHGVRLRLERRTPGAEGQGSEASQARLHLTSSDPSFLDAREIEAPNGARVSIVPKGKGYDLPPVQQSFVFQPYNPEDAWHAGRAGMLYRDLIPNRQGGRFIASHIRIPDGGPVPDYVHFHKVRFQMIFLPRRLGARRL